MTAHLTPLPSDIPPLHQATTEATGNHTALTAVAQQGHTGVCAQLLAGGADPSHRSEVGTYEEILAERHGQTLTSEHDHTCWVRALHP